MSPTFTDAKVEPIQRCVAELGELPSHRGEPPQGFVESVDSVQATVATKECRPFRAARPAAAPVSSEQGQVEDDQDIMEVESLCIVDGGDTGSTVLPPKSNDGGERMHQDIVRMRQDIMRMHEDMLLLRASTSCLQKDVIAIIGLITDIKGQLAKAVRGA